MKWTRTAIVTTCRSFRSREARSLFSHMTWLRSCGERPRENHQLLVGSQPQPQSRLASGYKWNTLLMANLTLFNSLTEIPSIWDNRNLMSVHSRTHRSLWQIIPQLIHLRLTLRQLLTLHQLPTPRSLALPMFVPVYNLLITGSVI